MSTVKVEQNKTKKVKTSVCRLTPNLLDDAKHKTWSQFSTRILKTPNDLIVIYE